MISLVTSNRDAHRPPLALAPSLQRKGNEDNARNNELALASTTDSYDAAAIAAATLETV